MTQSSTQPRPNQKCPCGSKKPHRNCCALKRFKWVKNIEGEWVREIPPSPELSTMIDKCHAQYNKIFEREPRGDDPLYLGQYIISNMDYEREVIEAMKKSGTRPEIVHAFKKTGLMISNENSNLLPDHELDAWDEAIDEYFDLEDNPQPIPEMVEDFADFISELDACIILFGFILDHGGDTDFVEELNSETENRYPTYAVICATRCFKTLRTINILLDKDISDDCYQLLRHIFENYLHIVYAKSHPNKIEDLVDAIKGLKTGTHEYKKNKSGKLDHRVIIEISTGKVFDGHISNFKMAISSENILDRDLFIHFYEMFSEFIHPNINTVNMLLNKEGNFDFKVNETHYDITLYALCFSCLVLDEVRILPNISELASKDIETVCNRISSRAIIIIEKYLNLEIPQYKCLLERMKCVGKWKREQK